MGDATLYLGDCMEILPTLQPVNAVISDPPFNAGKAIANDDMSPEDWRRFCTKLAACIAGNGAPNVLLEVGKDDAAMRSAMDAALPYRYAIALNYTNSMRNGAVGFANFGLVYWWGHGKCHERYMDRIDAPLESSKDEFSHPTPKMVAHYQRLVSMFTPKLGLVLDPFMGSGTTAVAAVQTGRHWVGYEVNRAYAERAQARIACC